MEKYGTPDVLDDSEKGIYKVAAKKMKPCCLEKLQRVDLPMKGYIVYCDCGNEIHIEKDE